MSPTSTNPTKIEGIVRRLGVAYFPYGRSSDRRDSRNRYRFIGVERDEDTGLCMTGPRTYDPVSGRFLQGDPLAWAQFGQQPEPGARPNSAPKALPTVAPAPYTYSSGNPVGRRDPTGLQDDPDALMYGLSAFENADGSVSIYVNNSEVLGSWAHGNFPGNYEEYSSFHGNFADLDEHIAELANGRPVSLLVLAVHGTPSALHWNFPDQDEPVMLQALSSPWRSDFDPTQDETIRNKGGLLSKDATVILQSCHVAKEPMGKQLVTEWSRALNATVIASENWEGGFFVLTGATYTCMPQAVAATSGVTRGFDMYTDPAYCFETTPFTVPYQEWFGDLQWEAMQWARNNLAP